MAEVYLPNNFMLTQIERLENGEPPPRRGNCDPQNQESERRRSKNGVSKDEGRAGRGACQMKPQIPQGARGEWDRCLISRASTARNKTPLLERCKVSNGRPDCIHLAVWSRNRKVGGFCLACQCPVSRNYVQVIPRPGAPQRNLPQRATCSPSVDSIARPVTSAGCWAVSLLREEGVELHEVGRPLKAARSFEEQTHPGDCFRLDGTVYMRKLRSLCQVRGASACDWGWGFVAGFGS